MKKANEVLPFYMNGESITEKSLFAELGNMKNGKLTRDFLLKCESGISPDEFEKLEKRRDFDKILAVLHEQFPDSDKAVHAIALKSFANTNRLLKKLDGTIPWEVYIERFPCLKLPKMIDDKCADNEHCWSCKTFHRRTYYHLIEMLLVRHEILSDENGIFADRLLTAIELGVPFSRIESYMGSTVDAAIAVLKKHFPYTNKDFLSQCANEYLESWHRLDSSPKENTSDFEAASVKN